MKFNKIAIIGVGLIGGSIGLAIKKRRLANEVIGVFRRKPTLKKALKVKAVDAAVMSVEEGVFDADLIIIASPVRSIPYLAAEAIKHAKRGAIITDVGSTKTWIVEKLDDMLKGSSSVKFIGSHPMAGSEQAGVEAARADLLCGAPCIVTRTANTDSAALNKVTSFWKTLGSRVTVMSPAKHDSVAAAISHLPHLVAFGLVGAVRGGDIRHAAEGFKDTTRVASSDPALWADIFLTNKTAIAQAVRAFDKSCKAIQRSLSTNDTKGLVGILKSAKSKRDKFIYGKTR